eukprot:1557540-Rhodomonas_salina.2
MRAYRQRGGTDQVNVGKFHAVDKVAVLEPVLPRSSVYPLDPHRAHVPLSILAIPVLMQPAAHIMVSKPAAPRSILNFSRPQVDN